MEITTNLPASSRQDAGSTACDRCHRDALVTDTSGTALCARHATIFMTVLKYSPGSGSSMQAGVRT